MPYKPYKPAGYREVYWAYPAYGTMRQCFSLASRALRCGTVRPMNHTEGR